MEFYLVDDVQPDEDTPLSPPVGRSQRTEARRRSCRIDTVSEHNETAST